MVAGQEMGGASENRENRRGQGADRHQDMGSGPSIERRQFLEEVIIDRIADRRAEHVIELLSDTDVQKKIVDLIPKIINDNLPIEGMPEEFALPINPFELGELKKEIMPMFQMALRMSGLLKSVMRHHIEQEFSPVSQTAGRMLELRAFLRSKQASDDVMQRFDILEQKVEQMMGERAQLVDDLINLALEQGLEFALQEDAERFLIRGKFPTRDEWMADRKARLQESTQQMKEMVALLKEVDPLGESEMARNMSLAERMGGADGPLRELLSFFLEMEADRIYK